MVIWARLPGLPAEYYDPQLLKKMGKKLGIILKIDAHANDALRGQYAHICVQVNIDKPGPYWIFIPVSYVQGFKYDLFCLWQNWT